MDEVIVSPEDQAATERRHPHVTVIYNGLSKEIAFRLNELVDEIRKRAIEAFGITTNPHILSLFTVSGAELPDNVTAHEAGIRPGQKLLLRPSTVKGGTNR